MSRPISILVFGTSGALLGTLFSIGLSSWFLPINLVVVLIFVIVWFAFGALLGERVFNLLKELWEWFGY